MKPVAAPRRKQTPAQRRKARREAEARRRADKRERAAAERAAAMTAEQLVAEEDQAREAALTGPAKTVVTAAMYRQVFQRWTQGWSIADLAEEHNLSQRRVSEIVEGLRGTELTRLGVGDTLFSVKFAQRLVLQRSAAASMSASAKTMHGALPPSSRWTRLRSDAAAFATSMPARTEPVIDTICGVLWSIIRPPVVRSPVITLSTPLGRNSAATSASRSVDEGVVSEGLSTVVLPAAIAGAIFHTAMLSG